MARDLGISNARHIYAGHNGGMTMGWPEYAVREQLIRYDPKSLSVGKHLI